MPRAIRARYPCTMWYVSGVSGKCRERMSLSARRRSSATYSIPIVCVGEIESRGDRDETTRQAGGDGGKTTSQAGRDRDETARQAGGDKNKTAMPRTPSRAICVRGGDVYRGTSFIKKRPPRTIQKEHA